MHQSRGFDPATGVARSTRDRSWTACFRRRDRRARREQRDDIVAITAAMCEPTGLGTFAAASRSAAYDVGIAEQHALTSAAGLASGGLHPVVAIYATFLNRAFDQLLMDVALHRLPVTFVLDRAGITGDDGPSHNGMWDLALLGMVPGFASPRRATNDPALPSYCARRSAVADGPTVLRYPKTPLGADLLRGAPGRWGGRAGRARPPRAGRRARRRVSARWRPMSSTRRPSVRLRRVTASRVVDPRWVTPVDPAMLALAAGAALVVTVEDGVVTGGVGTRIAQALRGAGVDVPYARDRRYPYRVPRSTVKVADVRAGVGLTVQDIGRRIVEWSASSRHEYRVGADGPVFRPCERLAGRSRVDRNSRRQMNADPRGRGRSSTRGGGGPWPAPRGHGRRCRDRR